MKSRGQIKARILTILLEASRHRIRPIDLERSLLDEGETSRAAIKRALNDLVKQNRVVYSYRDPCSFVEMPALANESPD